MKAHADIQGVGFGSAKLTEATLAHATFGGRLIYQVSHRDSFYSTVVWRDELALIILQTGIYASVDSIDMIWDPSSACGVMRRM